MSREAVIIIEAGDRERETAGEQIDGLSFKEVSGRAELFIREDEAGAVDHDQPERDESARGHQQRTAEAVHRRESPLANAEGGDTEDSQQHRDDEEARDDLGFGPAGFFEMMMQRRNLENAPSEVLEREHLDHHG